MRGYRKKGEEERIEGKMKERRKGEREEKKNQGQPGAVSGSLRTNSFLQILVC